MKLCVGGLGGGGILWEGIGAGKVVGVWDDARWVCWEGVGMELGLLNDVGGGVYLGGDFMVGGEWGGDGSYFGGKLRDGVE